MLPCDSVFKKACRQYSAECVNTLMLTLFLGSTPPDVCLQTKQFWVMGMFHLMSAYKEINFWSGKCSTRCLFTKQLQVREMFCLTYFTKQFQVRELFHLMSVYKAIFGQGNVPPDDCLQSNFRSRKCSAQHLFRNKAILGQGNVLPAVCLQTKQLMSVYKATSGEGNVTPGICLQSDFGSRKCST